MEAHGLSHDAFGIAVIGRIGLDGDAALQSLLALEHGQQQFGTFDSHLLDELPGDLLLAPVRFSAMIARMRSRQRCISFLSTPRTIVGLVVAPTAPCSMA